MTDNVPRRLRLVPCRIAPDRAADTNLGATAPRKLPTSPGLLGAGLLAVLFGALRAPGPARDQKKCVWIGQRKKEKVLYLI